MTPDIPSVQNSYTHEFKIQIHEKHLDAFGHVNHAVYLDLYELARWDLLTKAGYGLAEIKRVQVGPVVLEASIAYKRELLNREWIVIKSYMRPHERPTLAIIDQIMERPDAINDGQVEVVSSISLICGLMDLQKRRLIAPTEAWLDIVKNRTQNWPVTLEN